MPLEDVTLVKCCRRVCEISIANPSNRGRMKFKLRNNVPFPKEFFVGDSPFSINMQKLWSRAEGTSPTFVQNERGNDFIEYESHTKIGRETGCKSSNFNTPVVKILVSSELAFDKNSRFFSAIYHGGKKFKENIDESFTGLQNIFQEVGSARFCRGISLDDDSIQSASRDARRKTLKAMIDK